MEFLNGYKSYLGAGLGILVGIGQLLGYVDAEVSVKLYAIATAIFGIGFAGKVQKLADALTGAVKGSGAILIGVGVGTALLLAPAPAYAADCSFEGGLDAKLIRLSWPPAIGVNALGFVDFEFGISGMTTICANVSANIIGGLCLVPQIRSSLPLCPKDPAEDEVSKDEE